MKRRNVLKTLLCAGLIGLSGQASALPKMVRIVVPAGAGGPTDTQARLLAQELQRILGISVVVDNKPGASGLIGSAEVARAPSDGTTLLYAPDYVVTQAPHALKKMAFNPFTDLTPIARTADLAPVLLAGTQAPFSTVSELIKYAKTHPGEVSFASWGTGTGSHLYGEILGKRNDLQLTHVPYKGTADAMNDLLNNRVQFSFQPPSVVFQYPGKLKVLATAGTKRNPLLPELPTLHELGFRGFEMGGWVGFYGPGKMQPALVQKLNAAINQALGRPAVRAMWETQGCVVVQEPSEGIAAMLRRDSATWGKYFKEVGLEPQ